MKAKIIILLFYMGTFTSGELQITPIRQASGIYFEEIGKVELYASEWKVVAYYDLTGLTAALNQTTRYIGEINKFCIQLKDDIDIGQICNSTVIEINHLLVDIQNKYKLLYGKSRGKRGLINAVGQISKALFGTLSEDDAKHYDQQINTLNSNDEHLLTLLKNQTLIIETTANIFNKTQSIINSQISVINRKVLKLQSLLDDFVRINQETKIFAEMESLTSLTTLIIIRYQGILDNLVDLITDVKHGKPHPSILTPEQLDMVLTTIRKDLPNSIKLPWILKNNDVLPLYQISTLRATVIENKIIYEFRIPLPHKENFQLFKIIPLPTKFKGKFVFIQPSINYLVVDYDKNQFYDLESVEFSNCITQSPTQFLCRIIHPLFNLNSNHHKCEVQLLRRENIPFSSCTIRQTNYSTIWIQLSQTSKWLVSTRSNYIIDEICQDKITPYTLANTAIIEIPGNCYLRSKDLTIYGHYAKETDIRNSYLPPVNISSFMHNLELKRPNIVPEVALVKNTENYELTKLSNDLSTLKNEENKGLKSMNHHDIHHYFFIYTIIFIFIIIMVYKVHSRFTNNHNLAVQNISVGENSTSAQQQPRQARLVLVKNNDV